MIVEWIAKKTGVSPRIVTGVMLILAAVLWFSK